MPDETVRVPLNGRRREAARNDGAILAAARAVFVADPGAPIAAVAERAGVGIGALYRRYAGKEELLRTLCAEGLARYIAIAESALADDGDPAEDFAAFMTRVVEADTVSLSQRLAGTFTPTERLFQDAEHARGLNARLLERAQAAGVVRRDVEVDDLALLFEQIASVRIGDGARTVELRLRYLRVVLDGLADSSAAPLPGPAPEPHELGRRWIPAT